MDAGRATATPPMVQLVVNAVVEYNVVKLTMLSAHFVMILSAPRAGLGLTLRFTDAVSVHPELLVAINWYVPLTVTAVGVATAVPPNVQFELSPAVLNCVVRSILFPLQIVAA